MKLKRVRWGAMEVLLAVMLSLFVLGYLNNAYELAKLDTKTADWPEVLVRTAGVLVPPIGIIVGWRRWG